MSVNSCDGKRPPRGLKLKSCFHRYVRKWFYALLKNKEICTIAPVIIQISVSSFQFPDNPNIKMLNKHIHVFLYSYCMPSQPAGVYQGQVESKVNLDQAMSEITYTYPQQRQNLPGCFPANYFIIVVGALLLMTSIVLCVGLHEILNRQLALFWST